MGDIFLGWVLVGVIFFWVGVGGCGWVCHFSGWVWVGVTFSGWVWLNIVSAINNLQIYKRYLQRYKR